MQLSWRKQTSERKAKQAQKIEARHSLGLRAFADFAGTDSGYRTNLSVVNNPETGFISNPSLSDCGQLKI